MGNPVPASYPRGLVIRSRRTIHPGRPPCGALATIAERCARMRLPALMGLSGGGDIGFQLRISQHGESLHNLAR